MADQATCPQLLSACDLALQAGQQLITDQKGVIAQQSQIILAQTDRITTLEARGTHFWEKEWFWFAAGAIGTSFIIGAARK